MNRQLGVLWGIALGAFAASGCITEENPDRFVDAGTQDDAGVSPDVPKHVWTDCQASDQAWVRRAFVALVGRRPWGQAEVKAYADLIAAIRQVDAEGGNAPSPEGTLAPARAMVAQLLVREDAYRERWADFFQDALRVARVETKSFQTCYGAPNVSLADGGALAAWVRDHDPSATNPPAASFTMRQLLASSLELDDVSPLYRAHLFAMLSRPYTAANVGPLELERARRQNFGSVFERAYLHRDRVCLACHNSEGAVTFDVDPALNRHWPIPGLFEQALYGASNALHPPDEAPSKGSDELRALSMLRYDGVVDMNGIAPFGWNGEACGLFRSSIEDDPLGIDTYFGSLRSTPSDPTLGLRASVWDLENALHRGVDLLAEHGLQRLPDNVLADPDEAFAYLVAQNIVDQVWAEVMGQRLTIATYFPRTQIQRDILQQLTERFVAAHFSLQTLLFDIIAHPLFNLKSPDEGCGLSAYEVPRILNPWSNAEQDVTRRENSIGDGVFPWSPRPLRRSLHRAMHWPEVPEYPTGPEQEFQSILGVFLKDAEPGFRGLDFQGRLSWEGHYGDCPALTPNDTIHQIVSLAQNTPGTTLGDVVIAVKDRLIGQPWIETTRERPLLTNLLASSLEDETLTFLDVRARLACGVFVSSPQFMLGGIVPRDTTVLPKLTLPDASYAARCTKIASSAQSLVSPYLVECNAGTLAVTKE